MKLVEIIGFCGGALGIFVGVPQALQVRRLGHGKGVSLSAWLLMFAMYCAWCTYGIRISSPSAAISNFLTLLVVGSVLLVLIEGRYKSISILILIMIMVFFLIYKLPDSVVSVILVASVFSQLPQVIKSYRTRLRDFPSAVSTKALKIGISSVSLWLLYALVEGIWLMVLTSLISMTMSSLILFFERRVAL